MHELVGIVHALVAILVNHFSTIGRCSGPAHYDVSIRHNLTDKSY